MYISPQIRYGIELYGPACESQIKQVQVQQKTEHSTYYTTGILKHPLDNFIKIGTFLGNSCFLLVVGGGRGGQINLVRRNLI